MINTGLYCSKCRENLQHSIARMKDCSDDYKQVDVIKLNEDQTANCRCMRCGHKWVSKSKQFKGGR